MKITIFEPYSSGHRLHFVRLVAEAFLEIGLRPTWVTTSDALHSQEATTHLASCIDELDIIDLKTKIHRNRCGVVLEQMRLFSEMLRKSAPKRILIPTASQFIEAIIASRYMTKYCETNISIEALFLGPGFGYQFRRRRRNLWNRVQLEVSKLLPVESYFHLDPFQLQIVENKFASSKGKTQFTVMPDPAPRPITMDVEDARKALGIPVVGTYMLMTGGISRQKGAIALLNAFRNSPASQNPVNRIILAGKLTDEIAELIDAKYSDFVRNQQLVVFDHYLTENELSLAFCVANVVCALQSDRPGSSGNVVRAIAASRPALVSIGGWSERVVKQFKLGWVTDVTANKVLASDLMLAFQAAGSYVPSERAKQYSQFLSEENFKAHWTRRTRLDLNLPPDKRFISWTNLSDCSEKQSRRIEEPNF